jgi:dTMP kinase
MTQRRRKPGPGNCEICGNYTDERFRAIIDDRIAWICKACRDVDEHDGAHRITIDEMSPDDLKEYARWQQNIIELDRMEPYINSIAKYVVFEGIDGCGKTTQIDAVKDRLVAVGKDVVRLREPTKDSPFGKQLREVFARGERPSYDEEVMLFEEDRRWHMKWRVKHALMLNVIILQDRSYFSTAAYQGSAGRRTYHDFIKMHERFSFQPDVVILFDMDVDEAQRRLADRGEGETSMEHRDIQIAVRQAFLDIYRDYGKARNIVTIDASKPVDDITNDIMSILKLNDMY